MKSRLLVLALLLVAALGAWWLLANRGAREGPDSAAPRAAVEDSARATLSGRAAVSPPVPPAPLDTDALRASTTSKPAASAQATARLLVVVRGRDKQPIEGAHVRVLPEDAEAPEWAGSTDATGTLRLIGISVPNVRLFVRAGGFVSAENIHEDLSAEEERTCPIWLEPGAHLEGRVTEAATGKPLAGARVRTRGGGTTVLMSCSGGRESYGETVSDAEGRFRLTGLPLEWVVTVWADLEGWTRGETPVLFRSASAVREPVVLALARGGWLVAHVRGPSGEPAVGATVEALRDGMTASGAALPVGEVRVRDAADAEALCYALPLRGETDATGKCRILGLPFDTRFLVRAWAPKQAPSLPAWDVVTSAAEPEARADLRLRRPATLSIVSLDTGGRPLADVSATLTPISGDGTNRWPEQGRTVLPGLTPGPVRVELGPEGFLPVVLDLVLTEGETLERTVRFEEGATIEGLVVDETGTPLAKVVVQASRTGENGRWSTSDAQGRFRIAGLLPGEYGLQAVLEGVTFHLDDDDQPPDAIATAPAKDVRLVVRRQARVVAQFRVPDGGAIPESLMVWVSDDALGSSSGQSREWEKGRVEWVISPGKYRLGFTARGYAPFERAVELTAGQVVDLGDVLLDVGLTLEGRVVDGEDQPVPDVAVSAGFDDDSTARSGKDGRFVLEHLPRTPLVIWAQIEDYLQARLEVDPARSGFITVVLKRGGVLVGRVKTASGGPGGGLDIVVAPTDPNAKDHGHERTRSDVEGRFRARLAPGRYRVEVMKDDVVITTGEVTLLEGQETPLLLRLP